MDLSLQTVSPYRPATRPTDTDRYKPADLQTPTDTYYNAPDLQTPTSHQTPTTHQTYRHQQVTRSTDTYKSPDLQTPTSLSTSTAKLAINHSGSKSDQIIEMQDAAVEMDVLFGQPCSRSGYIPKRRQLLLFTCFVYKKDK